MSRIYVPTLALACCLFAVPTGQAATYHRHLSEQHVANKPAGVHSHGHSHPNKKDHHIATHHGKNGKVHMVGVGSGRHERAHKVKGNPHGKSRAPHKASTLGLEPPSPLKGLRDDPEDCQGGFLFIAFLVQFGGNTFVILVPIQFVDVAVINNADPNPPPDPTDCDGEDEEPQVRLEQPPWHANPIGLASRSLDLALLNSSERSRRS